MTAPARVLIVEDESLLLMLLEDLLPDMGYQVSGSAGTVEDALAALDRLPVDLALLDVNLGGTESFPVAAALAARGIPFLFTTGYGSIGLPAPYADAPVLQKPFRRQELEAALHTLGMR